MLLKRTFKIDWYKILMDKSEGRHSFSRHSDTVKKNLKDAVFSAITMLNQRFVIYLFNISSGQDRKMQIYYNYCFYHKDSIQRLEMDGQEYG
ncbi:unnamed protein product [Paramecium sonneborni]|uniref:Uncharacterized protein n=1 Tax=Paramecium sonneborni TaxID=65129 RepID=A0A8S1RLH2_9CILI|nr:unnamed protein product [Paramecium sonneborni]